jgi:dienelactone hydrolase
VLNILKATAIAALATLVLFSLTPAHAADVEHRRADIVSDGVRLNAHLFHPKSPDGPLPVIIMSHGWGGTAAGLQSQAAAFAQAGYYVIAFDYRGWGESDARVILSGPAPGSGPDERVVREIREVIDPLEQAADIFNVIHWAMGEPMADRGRLGLWGTSFSGGLVAYVAAREPRVRALVSQVGYFGQPVASYPQAELARSHGDATRRARGELPYPAPGATEIGNLRGAPLREKFLLYAPVEDVHLARDCAMLFIAAEREELFDNRRHPQLAFERAGEPKKYVVIPGISHYGIYGEAREQATGLAIEWFDRYLKN